jgi:hypothetical protein
VPHRTMYYGATSLPSLSKHFEYPIPYAHLCTLVQTLLHTRKVVVCAKD